MLSAEATTITCALQKRGTYATSRSSQLASGRAGRSAWLRREPPCAAWGSLPERPSQDAWHPASSNMLRTFAFSSAASSLRKPPESERCTICRRVVEGSRVAWAHRPESGQGSPLSPGLVKHTRLSCGTPQPQPKDGGESHVARRVPTLCVAWVATQRASGCAAQSVSTHLQQRGRGLGRARAPVAARPRGE